LLRQQAACGRRFYWTQRRLAGALKLNAWLFLNMALITWHGTVSFEKQSRISDTVGLLYRYVCCGRNRMNCLSPVIGPFFATVIISWRLPMRYSLLKRGCVDIIFTDLSTCIRYIRFWVLPYYVDAWKLPSVYVWSCKWFDIGGILASAGWERFGDPPPRWIQVPSMVSGRDGRPPRGPLAVRCFCVCSDSALLGGLFGVSRSRERDLLSVLLIYPNIFSFVFIVYCRIVFCYMLMSVGCFGLVVSTCQLSVLPFGRICFVVLVMRIRGESSWSGPWHLRCTQEIIYTPYWGSTPLIDVNTHPQTVLPFGCVCVCVCTVLVLYSYTA